jgi:4-amino-4-deoxy-L-arabinose transferase-like glycosyltransferase
MAGPPQLLVVLLATLLCRLPSLNDPPWVNDEGTYFAVAQAMAHGYRLYDGVWENKPPALYLVYSAVYHSFGASLIGVRLVVMVAVLGLVWTVWRLARRMVGEEWAPASALLTGVLFGLPVLEGTTGNAEVFVALFAALAVEMALVRRVPWAGGVLIGVAVLFKVVAAFDGIAIGLALLGASYGLDGLRAGGGRERGTEGDGGAVCAGGWLRVRGRGWEVGGGGPERGTDMRLERQPGATVPTPSTDRDGATIPTPSTDRDRATVPTPSTDRDGATIPTPGLEKAGGVDERSRADMGPEGTPSATTPGLEKDGAMVPTAVGESGMVLGRGRGWLREGGKRTACGVLAYGTAAVAVVGVVCGAAALVGDLGGMIRDAVLYDVGYVGHGNGGGVPWLLGAKVVVLVALTGFVWRRPFPVLWLVYATFGALFSGRVFGHYLLQMVVPLSLTLPLTVQGRRRVARVAPAAVFGAFLVGGTAAGIAGWALAATGHDSILARRLQYYPNAIRLAVGQESYGEYRDQIDDHVARNEAVARSLRAMPAGTLVVWGNTPWVYVLSGRLPATPYTSALRSPEVPGETTALRQSVEGGTPAEVVVIAPAHPSLGGATRALSRLYVRREVVEDASIYVRSGRGE